MGMNYALPIMRARGFEPAGHPSLQRQPFDTLTLGVYWDRGRKYARTPFEDAGYIEVIREKVLHDITHDPVWYLTILAKRVGRLVTDTTPPTLSRGRPPQVSLPPSAAWGLLPVGVAAVVLRAPQCLPVEALLLFLAPLASHGPARVFGAGTTYYSVVHLVAFGLCVAWVLEAILGAWSRGRLARRKPRGTLARPGGPARLELASVNSSASAPAGTAACPVCAAAPRSWFVKAGRAIIALPVVRGGVRAQGSRAPATGATIYESGHRSSSPTATSEYYLDDESNLASAREEGRVDAWLRPRRPDPRCRVRRWPLPLQAASPHYSASAWSSDRWRWSGRGRASGCRATWARCTRCRRGWPPPATR